MTAYRSIPFQNAYLFGGKDGWRKGESLGGWGGTEGSGGTIPHINSRRSPAGEAGPQSLVLRAAALGPRHISSLSSGPTRLSPQHVQPGHNSRERAPAEKGRRPVIHFQTFLTKLIHLVPISAGPLRKRKSTPVQTVCSANSARFEAGSSFKYFAWFNSSLDPRAGQKRLAGITDDRAAKQVSKPSFHMSIVRRQPPRCLLSHARSLQVSHRPATS